MLSILLLGKLNLSVPTSIPVVGATTSLSRNWKLASVAANLAFASTVDVSAFNSAQLATSDCATNGGGISSML